jgi:hypothetical protein
MEHWICRGPLERQPRICRCADKWQFQVQGVMPEEQAVTRRLLLRLATAPVVGLAAGIAAVAVHVDLVAHLPAIDTSCRLSADLEEPGR